MDYCVFFSYVLETISFIFLCKERRRQITFARVRIMVICVEIRSLHDAMRRKADVIIKSQCL